MNRSFTKKIGGVEAKKSNSEGKKGYYESEGKK
jgi:hypothetical protein